MEKNNEPTIEMPFVIEDDSTYIWKDSRGTFIVDKARKGVIPRINVYAETIPAAYELALIANWDHGTRVSTHYDRKGDPPSIESTLSAKISNPFNEPRISRIYPGGPDSLEIYKQEVIKGIHDHWINPQEGKWTYTYHERIFDNRPSEDLYAPGRGFLVSGKKLDKFLKDAKSVDEVKDAFEKGKLYVDSINQIEKAVLDDLERDITSKGAQAVIWMPSADPGLESNRPCLQSLWFRVLENMLNLNVRFRSRDGWGAWIMNVDAITELQKYVAGRLCMRVDEPIMIGSYDDTADSFHFYGRDHERIGAWVEKIKKNPDMRKRVYNSYDVRVQEGIEEVREKLAKDVDFAKGN